MIIGFLGRFGRSNLKFSAVEIPAVGNRVYTNDVRLRGRRGYLEIENHRVNSSTRAGGFCLCRRGFNRRGFWFFGGWAIGFFVDGAIGFFVDGRSHFFEMGDRVFVNGRSPFFEMGDRVFVNGRSGFCGWAIGFL